MKMFKFVLRKIYHLIAFLSLFLFFINPVKAVSGNPNTNGTEFTTAIGATFLDNTNGNLTTVDTRWNNTGKYYTADLTLNAANTSGANLNIKLLEPVVNGYTYILSVLVGAPVFLKTSDSKFCIAENLSNNVERWNRNMCVNTFYRDFATGANFNIVDSSYSTTIGYTVLYYGFTANVTASSVMLVFQSQQSMSNSVIFGGYKLELISDNKQLTQQQITSAVQNSGLATANSVSQVQQGINEVKQEIQGMEQQQQQTNEKLDDIDDTLNNDNVDGANSQVDNLLNNSNFSDNTGIQAIINAPLNFISSLSNTCSPINLTIPYIDKPVQIPCIKQELNNHIPLVVPVLSTAINGFIIYRILLDLVRIIKNARNPDDDRIEVLDL